MKREVRRINWYTAKKEKTNDAKVIKDQTYCIFYNLNDLSTNNTISLGFQMRKAINRWNIVVSCLLIQLTSVSTISHSQVQFLTLNRTVVFLSLLRH